MEGTPSTTVRAELPDNTKSTWRHGDAEISHSSSGSNSYSDSVSNNGNGAQTEPPPTTIPTVSRSMENPEKPGATAIAAATAASATAAAAAAVITAATVGAIFIGATEVWGSLTLEARTARY